MEIMKIENVVPYYSEGPSSRKFRDWKKKMVAIFEKAQVLEQYWFQIAEFHLMGETLSYWEDEKRKLGLEVQWEEFVRIMKDYEQRSTKDPSNLSPKDPRTPITPTPVSLAPIDMPYVDP